MTTAEWNEEALHRASWEVWSKACDHYAIRCALPRIDLTLRGQVAGQAVWKEGHRGVFRRRNDTSEMLLRFNLDAYHLDPEYVISTVIPHEVAHLFVRLLFPKQSLRPHGREWQSVMQDCFDISRPSRTHRLELPRRRQHRRPYRYLCLCGKKHLLTAIRHNRARKGTVYLCRSCRKPLTFDACLSPANDS